jgi:Zn-dependent protease with chaperone function
MAQVPGVARIRHVPDRSLNDAALAVADARRPVVYYNPTLLNRFGPELAAFVMAHEYGHIAHGHVRVRAEGTRESGEAHAIMRRYELEADCYAARMLSNSNPGAVGAAIAYFSRMGERQVDDDHPTGSARAATLQRCLPGVTVAAARSAPTQAPDPVSGTTAVGTGAGLVEREQ